MPFGGGDMSNVLIGIIGVILFIGLALAGALILGDDFLAASNSTQASTLVSRMKQTADAIEMYRLKTGRSQVPVTSVAFLMPRFLKTMPINPVASATANPNSYFWSIRLDNNLYPVQFDEPVYAAKFVMAPVGPRNDPKARGICEAINESLGVAGIAVDATAGDPRPTNQAGCLQGIGNEGTANADYYIAYMMIAPITQNLVLPPN
jgi:hypothetical protein